MRRISNLLSGVSILFIAVAAHAAGMDRGAFLGAREEIQRLAVERIRSAHSDFERVVVAAENRLRALHETQAADGGLVPTSLDSDLRELRGACQKMQRRVAAGRVPEPDNGAQKIVDRRWKVFRVEFDALLDGIEEKKRKRVPESQIYWDSLRVFKGLRDTVKTDLLYNTPSGERGLNAALSRDETVVHKACESMPKKTRAKSPDVIAPHEHAGTTQPDIQSFYRSLDLVPDARPHRAGSFSIPVGARTVTLRENASRLVFRPRRGKGIAYFGSTEVEVHYGYVAVPPDTAYYFENTGTEPLDLDYVGVKP